MRLIVKDAVKNMRERMNSHRATNAESQTSNQITLGLLSCGLSVIGSGVTG